LVSSEINIQMKKIALQIHDRFKRAKTAVIIPIKMPTVTPWAQLALSLNISKKWV